MGKHEWHASLIYFDAVAKDRKLMRCDYWAAECSGIGGSTQLFDFLLAGDGIAHAALPFWASSFARSIRQPRLSHSVR